MEDLSDLIDKIKWCRANDKKCQEIAQNARRFYDTYLNKNSMLDYMQKILIDAKNISGTYAYNVISPLNYQINMERNNIREIEETSPPSIKPIDNIGSVPYTERTHSLLKGMEYTIHAINRQNAFEKIAKYQKDIFLSKTGFVRKFSLADFSLAVKSTNDEQKKKEHIHETFIALRCINELSMLCPNFAYVMGTYETDNTQNVIVEHLDGITLSDYLTSKDFNFKTFLFLLLQIAAALSIAQQKCAFVHYDLMPWNIMVTRFSEIKKIKYALKMNQILEFETDIIPVIIDFGKSHIIYDNTHYGFTQMYKFSTIHDIVTLISNSLNTLLSKKDFFDNKDDILALANFMTGNDYRMRKFTRTDDLKNFLEKSRRYFTMLYSDKHQLENKTPYDFIKYIHKTFGEKYKFNFGSKNASYNYMDVYTGRQVFDFIFSNTTEERLNSFASSIERLKSSTIPMGENKLETYYAGQSLMSFLSELHHQYDVFTESKRTSFNKREKFIYEKYRNLLEQTEKFIHDLYSSLLEKATLKSLAYDASVYASNSALVVAPYTHETFSLPTDIQKMIVKKHIATNPSQFFFIILTTLKNTKNFTMTEGDREFYTNNLNVILKANPVILMNNIANENTLIKTAKAIYERNIDQLTNSDDVCDFTRHLIFTYTKILEQ